MSYASGDHQVAPNGVTNFEHRTGTECDARCRRNTGGRPKLCR
jgi:hypothetical protein